MIVTKNNKTYVVTELKKEWKITDKQGKLEVVYHISKELAADEKAVKAFILKTESF